MNDFAATGCILGGCVLVMWGIVRVSTTAAIIVGGLALITMGVGLVRSARQKKESPA